MKWNKVIAAILLMVILVTMVSGCSNAKKDSEVNTDSELNVDSEGNAVDVAMGRYVEENIELPEGLVVGTEATYQMIKNPEGKIELSCRLRDAAAGESTVIYTLKEDNTWERIVPKWMNQKDRGEWNSAFFAYAPDGTRYVLSCFNDQKRNKYSTQILKSTDGEKTEEVVIDEKYTSAAYRIKVLPEDTLILNGINNCNIMKEGKVIASFNHKAYVASAISDNMLMLPNLKGNGASIYDLNTNQVLKEIPFQDTPNFLEFTTDEDGNWYMVSDLGIYRLVKDGSTWEMIIDGELASMSDPSMEGWDIIVGDNEIEDFYVMYGYNIKHYVYNKDIPTVPSETISVTSLKENNTIRQVITKFRESNPDLRIQYTVLMSEENEMNISDYIKVINTELLAGKGADIFILDEMPIDSYIEKGVLADLSDIINPLVNDGTILGNKIECFKRDGKLFYAPTRFSISLAYGQKEAVKSTDTLESLANYAKNIENRGLISSYTYSYLISLLFKQYSSSFIGDDGLFDKDELSRFLEQLKVISNQSKATETAQVNFDEAEYRKHADGYVMYLGYTEMAFIQIDEMSNIYIPMSTIEAKEGAWNMVNKEEFIPRGLIGINNASTKKELASEFVKICYSEEVQEKEFFEGLPLNVKVLEDNYNRKDGIVRSDNDYIIKQPSIEIMKQFIDIAKSVNVPVQIDGVLLDMVIAETVPYLKGEIEVPETADKIIAKAKIYLAE